LEFHFLHFNFCSSKSTADKTLADLQHYRCTKLTCRVRNHWRESFGRPRTVLCHTTGKFVTLQKFCVTPTVLSRLMTTCHQPPGTNTVSPGPCSISIYHITWQSTLLQKMTLCKTVKTEKLSVNEGSTQVNCTGCGKIK